MSFLLPLSSVLTKHSQPTPAMNTPAITAGHSNDIAVTCWKTEATKKLMTKPKIRNFHANFFLLGYSFMGIRMKVRGRDFTLESSVPVATRRL